MPYPWPSLGTFMFSRRESAIYPTDLGWKANPSRSRKRPLGSSRDSIITMAVGSLNRTFEIYAEYDRWAQLTAIIGTVTLFTDWERPNPDSRMVYVDNVEPIGEASQQCVAGQTHLVRRLRISLLSQS